MVKQKRNYLLKKSLQKVQSIGEMIKMDMRIRNNIGKA